MSASSNPVQDLRAALIFTGFLGGTCKSNARSGGVHALVNQTKLCRATRRFSRCDVFLHTWRTLTKANLFEVNGRNWTASAADFVGGRVRNQSSLKCVETIQRQLGIIKVVIEDQTSPTLL